MPLDPQRVQAVFLSAVECREPAARAAVLDRECSTDAELRQRVEALLVAYDQPNSLLDQPIVGPGGQVMGTSGEPPIDPSSWALYQRALEFRGESVRLRPTDSITAHDFLLATQDTVSMLSASGRKDEAIAELRRSVKILGEMASANADTPKNQEFNLEISRNLADRLIESYRPEEAVRARINEAK
jgi:hypothetical protein